ncbi:MAG: DUF4954 family protein [Prevotella sp.]
MRSLTVDEINILETNGCRAEDWTSINVAEDFSPEYIREVDFYGEVTLGVFNKSIQIDNGFQRHSGIMRAVLRDVSIGDNCLIENIGNYISRYDIGEECVISNVGMIATTDEPTFGQNNQVAVLNEAGDPNIILYDGLTTQMAALMIRTSSNKKVWNNIAKMVERHVDTILPERGTIGYRAKIANTREIVNVIIDDDCEINGASLLVETTLKSSPEASIFVGHDVICENTIVQAGASIIDGAKLGNCFVGEACHIGRGFSAESSVFFANSYMDNGESCAAFCGPFSVSHHKASLLIGVDTSFYNAGSATNFSNHAYKMGPMHYGTLERGSKTASGAHILMPATIGPFTMCMGKIQSHPDTSALPFSYAIAEGRSTRIIPGVNFSTVGTYRDIMKWPKRDKRPVNGRRSIVNTDWLNPFVIQRVAEGRKLLMQIAPTSDESEYSTEGYTMRGISITKGIKYYDMGIKMFIAEAVKKAKTKLPNSTTGTGEWLDLSGLLIPKSEINELLNDISSDSISDIQQIEDRLLASHNNYSDYKWNYAYRLALDYYSLDTITIDDVEMMIQKGEEARVQWLNNIRQDAEKEYQLGDVDEQTLTSFIEGLK